VAVSAAERRFILDNLTRLVEADIRNLWRLAEIQSDVEFSDYVIRAFPDIVAPYHELASQTSATFFEEDFPDIAKVPVVADPLPEEKLINSARWALQGDGKQAISRMAGTAQRAIYDGDRTTTVANVGEQNMRWVRVARPNACAFCRLLASRTANGETYAGAGVKLKINPETGKPYEDRRKTTVVYGRRRSGSKRKMASEYHDFCHCVAIAIPTGVDPMEYLARTEPQAAELAQQWNDEYLKARADAGTGDTKQILSSWRKQEGVEVYTPKRKPAATGDLTPDVPSPTLLPQPAVKLPPPAPNEPPPIGEVLSSPADAIDRINSEALAALEAGDDARADELFAKALQLESAEQKKAARAAARAARREAKDAAKQQRIFDLVEQGWQPDQAESEVYGRSLDFIRRRDFMSAARASGHVGERFDDLVASMHADYVAEQYWKAEAATNGYMIRREYVGKFNPQRLWSVNDATARRVMSDEMAAWFDANGGRITRSVYRQAVLDGSSVFDVAMQQDFLR